MIYHGLQVIDNGEEVICLHSESEEIKTAEGKLFRNKLNLIGGKESFAELNFMGKRLKFNWIQNSLVVESKSCSAALMKCKSSLVHFKEQFPQFQNSSQENLSD